MDMSDTRPPVNDARGRHRRWLLVLFLAGSAAACGGSGAEDAGAVAGAAATCAPTGAGVDLRQAEAMVSLLEAMDGGADPTGRVLAVTELSGTDLIVQQMNLARRVTKDQYRSLLDAVARGVEPDIQPVDTTARARRGVQGLVRDVRGLLAWGQEHADAIRVGLDVLAARSMADSACARALALLPEPVALSPSFSVVAGGRAGAAALGDGDLYVDALIATRLAVDAGGTFLDPERVETFFTHEAHHLGLAALISQGRDSLTLEEPETFAFQVLTLLALEGSATYLVDWNGHREEGGGAADFKELLADAPALLADVQTILSTVLDEPVTDRSRFEAVTSAMVGNRYHATGAILVAEIDERLGRDRLMEALRDPRQLAAAFNQARSTSEEPAAFTFDPALAQRLSRLGS